MITSWGLSILCMRITNSDYIALNYTTNQNGYYMALSSSVSGVENVDTVDNESTVSSSSALSVSTLCSSWFSWSSTQKAVNVATADVRWVNHCIGCVK